MGCGNTLSMCLVTGRKNRILHKSLKIITNTVLRTYEYDSSVILQNSTNPCIKRSNLNKTPGSPLHDGQRPQRTFTPSPTRCSYQLSDLLRIESNKPKSRSHLVESGASRLYSVSKGGRPVAGRLFAVKYSTS